MKEFFSITLHIEDGIIKVNATHTGDTGVLFETGMSLLEALSECDDIPQSQDGLYPVSAVSH